MKVTAIFATHIHEIVDYEEIENMETLLIKHMEVQYDDKNDKLIYNRKLKDGPGSCMYGLEVCKSLHLPDKFLKNAYDIRRKYKKEERSVLEQKPSHFNRKKIMYHNRNHELAGYVLVPFILFNIIGFYWFGFLIFFPIVWFIVFNYRGHSGWLCYRLCYCQAC